MLIKGLRKIARTHLKNTINQYVLETAKPTFVAMPPAMQPIITGLLPRMSDNDDTKTGATAWKHKYDVTVKLMRSSGVWKARAISGRAVQ